jgi:predicted transcriptional regulator
MAACASKLARDLLHALRSDVVSAPPAACACATCWPRSPIDSEAGEGYITTGYYHVMRGSAMATSLKIDDGLKSRVQQLASQRRRSAHWIMLEAIEQYVQREEARESFKQEALASWVAYQETGRHLTVPEVRTWLNTWGTDDEKAVPECHK